MTAKTKEQLDAELQTKLAAIQTTIVKLREQKNYPEWVRNMAAAVPTDAVRSVVHDLRRGVAEPSSIMPQPSQPQVERGSGWREQNPLGPPSGVAICDQLVDQQDRVDKADLARRLARSGKKE